MVLLYFMTGTRRSLELVAKIHNTQALAAEHKRHSKKQNSQERTMMSLIGSAHELIESEDTVCEHYLSFFLSSRKWPSPKTLVPRETSDRARYDELDFTMADCMIFVAKRFTAVDLDEGGVEIFHVFNDIDQRVTDQPIEVSVDVLPDASCQKQTTKCFRRFCDNHA